MRERHILAGLVLGLTWTVLAAGADRPWYQDYEEALAKLKKGDASGAIPLLERALQTGPDPGPQRPTYGMHFMDFFPYLYLARAYWQMGQCDRAQEFLERSARMDRLPPGLYEAEFRPLHQQIQARCVPPARAPVEPSAPPTAPPPVPAPTPSEVPGAEAPSVRPSVPTEVLQAAWRAYRRGDYDGAYRVLQEARRRYELDDTGYFILGCSRAARYFREGGTDGRLLEEARRYLRRVRRLPPELERSLSLFISPKILALYEGSRRLGSGEE
jgi:tetratricopeptide (TPR) repeat protein